MRTRTSTPLLLARLLTSRAACLLPLYLHLSFLEYCPSLACVQQAHVCCETTLGELVLPFYLVGRVSLCHLLTTSRLAELQVPRLFCLSGSPASPRPTRSLGHQVWLYTESGVALTLVGFHSRHSPADPPCWPLSISFLETSWLTQPPWKM